MVQPEWQSYYEAKVCMLDQFADYLGSDILRTGGTAVLESELSGIIRPVMQESKVIPDLLRPSLHKGPLLTFTVVGTTLRLCPSQPHGCNHLRCSRASRVKICILSVWLQLKDAHSPHHSHRQLLRQHQQMQHVALQVLKNGTPWFKQ